MFCPPFPCWAHGLFILVTTCVQSSYHLFAQWCFHHSSVYHVWLWSCVLLLPSVRLPHLYLLHLLYHHCFFLTNSACYWPWSRFIPGLTLCVVWSPRADLCLSDYYHHPLLSRPNARLKIQSSLQASDVLRRNPAKPWHQIWWCISRFILMLCISDHCLYAKRVRSVRVWVKNVMKKHHVIKRVAWLSGGNNGWWVCTYKIPCFFQGTLDDSTNNSHIHIP